MTAVYINDQQVDVDEDQVVAASYGNIAFGKLNKRKGVKSNTWGLPFTPRNKAVYESCEVQGSYSAMPYRKADIRVEIDGVIVFEGFCVLDEAKDDYRVQSFSGGSDFYNTINKRKLAELDFSDYNHIWNESNITNSWANVDGYIYAYVDYNKGNPFYLEGMPPDFFLPQIFFHTVIRMIAEQAGYTLTGDVLENPRFLRHLILANKFPLSTSYGGTWDLASIMPDLTQSKVWLDFGNIYGLQFDIDEVNMEIRANYIDDILFNEPEDWTNKIDKKERPTIKYRFDEYGQKSYLRYKSDPITDLNPCYQDFAKEIVIDDNTLQSEADVYKSEFYLIQDADPIINPGLRAITFTFNTKPGKGFGGVWNAANNYIIGSIVWDSGTYWQATANNINEDPSSHPASWTAIEESEIWETKSRPMYGALTIDPVSFIYVKFDTPVNVSRIVNTNDMDWDYTFEHHYRVFERILDRTKRVEPLVKLNYADINQVDFTKAKRIDNELYFLEEVTQFKLNRKGESTLCNLVRI